MNKSVFCLLFLVTVLTGQVFAQNEFAPRFSQADKLFNIYPPFVKNIHTAHLRKNEKMIVELADLSDYDMLNHLDSVLYSFMEDIAFYKDSIPATGNVRIDYVVTEEKRDRIIRFKKYEADGVLFVKQNDEVARLKLEQDTVHITLQKKPNDRSDHAHFYDFPVQITFCLNNYADIDTLLADKGLITAVVDTLKKAIPPNKLNPEYNFPYSVPTKSTVDYYPYRAYDKMYRSSEILPHGNLGAPGGYGRNKLAVYVNLAAGLVRNTLAPSAELGLTKLHFSPHKTDPDNFQFTSVYLSSLFLFSQAEFGGQSMYQNYFVNLETGASGNDEDVLGLKVKSVSGGVGYLFIRNGDYFQRNTFRFFMGFRLKSGISLYPEIIADNNFKQLFPGLSVKLFGFKREQQKRRR